MFSQSLTHVFQHFTSEASSFKALISSFAVLQASTASFSILSPSHALFCWLQPRFVRVCRHACTSSASSEAFARIPALLVELSVAACQLHGASFYSSSSLSTLSPAARPLLASSALIPLAANCVGTFS
jgi:hypothetical protein